MFVFSLPGDVREYYAVAVVKRDSDIQRLSDIRGKKACFSGVGNLAGWVMPIAKVSPAAARSCRGRPDGAEAAVDFRSRMAARPVEVCVADRVVSQWQSSQFCSH